MLIWTATLSDGSVIADNFTANKDNIVSFKIVWKRYIYEDPEDANVELNEYRFRRNIGGQLAKFKRIEKLEFVYPVANNCHMEEFYLWRKTGTVRLGIRIVADDTDITFWDVENRMVDNNA